MDACRETGREQREIRSVRYLLASMRPRVRTGLRTSTTASDAAEDKTLTQPERVLLLRKVRGYEINIEAERSRLLRTYRGFRHTYKIHAHSRIISEQAVAGPAQISG